MASFPRRIGYFFLGVGLSNLFAWNALKRYHQRTMLEV